MEATLAAYNAAARDPAAPDPAGSPPPRGGRRTSRRRADRLLGPAPLLYPAPVLGLGRLVVDPGSGHVLRPDGSPVDGLYGRRAPPAVLALLRRRPVPRQLRFSGRRAGHHAAGHHVAEGNETGLPRR